MAWQLAARAHAALHGLFRPTEAAVVKRDWDALGELFRSLEIADAEGRQALITVVARSICETKGIGAEHPQADRVSDLVRSIFDYEALFIVPHIDWHQKRSIAELWAIREECSRQRALASDIEATIDLLVAAANAILDPLYDACPALLEDAAEVDGIAIDTHLLRSIGNLGQIAQAILHVPFDETLVERGLLNRLRTRLERNVIAASGGNPGHPASFTRAPKLPEQWGGGEPEELVASYFGGTPLAPLFDQPITFTLPTACRFEHHHIVAGSGHGKTQTLQYLIANDLRAVAEGKRSVIVLDSQGDLIRTVADLALFGPDGPLHDRVVIIDPSDVEWPVSLNLFDVGLERLTGYQPLERERLTNSILELYDFVLGTLLSAEMTQKQNVIFRYVTRLMLHIPDATIHTLRELMEPGSEKRFAKDIAKLTGSARQFFEREFSGREFDQTKKQVLRRLWGILENQTFERMFTHPRSKLDLFAEMNAGKVILINTAKDLLKEQGTEIFGRFFIALIAQAAQERATLPAGKRMPTIVYVDEAQDYFDRNIGLILAQARKYNVGMVLAHQYLGQLEPKLQEAFAANTAIKFAGGVSAKDARSLASMMYCSPELIEAQPKGCFAAHVRGQTTTALPLAFPFGVMEAMPRMNAFARDELRARMRSRYATHVSECDKQAERNEDSREAGETSYWRAVPDDPPGHTDTTPGTAW